MALSSRKRTIDDFFGRPKTTPQHTEPQPPTTHTSPLKGTSPTAPPKQSPNHPNQPTLPPTNPHPTKVPGLNLINNFITPTEEASILSFLEDPAKCHWRTDLSRRTMHFGGTYCLFNPPSSTQPGAPSAAKPEVLQAPSMPPELKWLLDRFEAKGVFEKGKRPQYCIINEYTGSLGISAHVENFAFGEPVVGLSLLCDVNMRFHELVREEEGSVRSGKAGKCERTGRREDVLLVGRGLCFMRGKCRWGWQHEILRSARGRGLGWRRVSLTFRWKPGG